MKKIAKILLLLSIPFFIAFGIYTTMCFVRNYAITGSYFGVPGYVPIAPLWAQLAFNGSLLLLTVDMIYLFFTTFTFNNEEVKE